MCRTLLRDNLDILAFIMDRGVVEVDCLTIALCHIEELLRVDLAALLLCVALTHLLDEGLVGNLTPILEIVLRRLVCLIDLARF